MKIYKVKVNGKVYEVELESVSTSNNVIEQPKGEQKVEMPAAAGAGTEINAPMAGTILNVLVKVGQTVKAGEAICILEAMKLENEVVAPVSGTVKSVVVNKGDAVENGKLIAIIG